MMSSRKKIVIFLPTFCKIFITVFLLMTKVENGLTIGMKTNASTTKVSVTIFKEAHLKSMVFMEEVKGKHVYESIGGIITFHIEAPQKLDPETFTCDNSSYIDAATNESFCQIYSSINTLWSLINQEMDSDRYVLPKNAIPWAQYDQKQEFGQFKSRKITNSIVKEHETSRALFGIFNNSTRTYPYYQHQKSQQQQQHQQQQQQREKDDTHFHKQKVSKRSLREDETENIEEILEDEEEEFGNGKKTYLFRDSILLENEEKCASCFQKFPTNLVRVHENGSVITFNTSSDNGEAFTNFVTAEEFSLHIYDEEHVIVIGSEKYQAIRELLEVIHRQKRERSFHPTRFINEILSFCCGEVNHAEYDRLVNASFSLQNTFDHLKTGLEKSNEQLVKMVGWTKSLAQASVAAAKDVLDKFATKMKDVDERFQNLNTEEEKRLRNQLDFIMYLIKTMMVFRLQEQAVQKWKFAEQECKAGRVPMGVVTLERLNSEYEATRLAANKEGYQPLFETAYDLVQAKDSQIVHCDVLSETDETRFMQVVIHVPVVREQQKINKYYAVPFDYGKEKGKVCYLSFYQLTTVVGQKTGRIVALEKSQSHSTPVSQLQLKSKSEKLGNLIRMPTWNSRPDVSKECIEAIHGQGLDSSNWDSSLIFKKCSISCSIIDGPDALQIKENLWVFYNIQNLTIRDDKTGEQTMVYKKADGLEGVGSIQVTLGCHSSVIFDNLEDQRITSVWPCMEDVQHNNKPVHIIPGGSMFYSTLTSGENTKTLESLILVTKAEGRKIRDPRDGQVSILSSASISVDHFLNETSVKFNEIESIIGVDGPKLVNPFITSEDNTINGRLHLANKYASFMKDLKINNFENMEWVKNNIHKVVGYVIGVGILCALIYAVGPWVIVNLIPLGITCLKGFVTRIFSSYHYYQRRRQQQQQPHHQRSASVSSSIFVSPSAPTITRVESTQELGNNRRRNTDADSYRGPEEEVIRGSNQDFDVNMSLRNDYESDHFDHVELSNEVTPNLRHQIPAYMGRMHGKNKG